MAGYAALRIALIPPDPGVISGFSHDSGYIAIVARNVLAGRGLVNDALWLVFLDAPSLPVPFHNANPLYPLCIALVAWLTGQGVAGSGFLVSALASVALLATLIAALSRRLPLGHATLAAACAALSPLVATDSFRLLPDALATTLIVGCAALLAARGDGMNLTICAGAVFGLAWLTRSSAILAAPSIALFVLLRSEWRRGVTRLVAFALTAFAVALPWLVHTYRTWGSPFRSDNAYGAFAELYARPFRGSLYRFWHSPIEPPPVSDLVWSDPSVIRDALVYGAPRVVRELTMAWAGNSRGVALLLAVPLVYFFARAPRRLRHPTTLATALYAGLLVLVMAFRPGHVELRYFEPLNVAIGLWVALGTIEAVDDLRRRHLPTRLGAANSATVRWWQRTAPLAAACGGLVWLAVIPVRIFRDGTTLRSINPELVEYRRIATTVRARFAGPTPVVVGDAPYFFTAMTGTPSLSMPESDDTFLRGYMERYGARFVLLTRRELEFWRPAWREHGPPAWLRLVAQMDGALLYQVAPRATP